MQNKFIVLSRTALLLGSLFFVCFLGACGKEDNPFVLQQSEGSVEIEVGKDTSTDMDDGFQKKEMTGAQENDQSQDDWQGLTGKAADQKIYVQVIGCVKYPGVYCLEEEARVYEAIELAGGLLEDAQPDCINQAQKLQDGQMIEILSKEQWLEREKEQPAVAEKEQSDDRININTADADTLCTLSGVGQSRAESIIAYRQEHGDFQSVEEIMQVPGIKDGLFQKIKNKIKV